MYPEYEKVNKFLAEASELLNTNRTLEDIFNSIFERNKKKISTEYINDNGKIKHYRYKKMLYNIYCYADYIVKEFSMLQKHNVVGLKVANGPHWGELFWAILLCGYKPLLIDAKASKEGTQNVLNQSHAVGLISDDSYHYTVKKISLDNILQSNSFTNSKGYFENEVIFCSSGTTGDVKLMVFNGENLVHQICSSLDLPKGTKDIMYPDKMGKIKILSMVPFHHIFGFVAVFLWYTFYGKTIVYPASNAPSDIQYVCQKVGITHVFSVPLFWNSLSVTIQRKIDLLGAEKQKLLEKVIKFNTGEITVNEAGLASKPKVQSIIQNMLLGNKLRYCISGGGFISEETLRIINGLGYPLYNGFGMTEIGVTSFELSNDVKVRMAGYIGRPLHGMEYKISNDNDAKANELLIKSPTIHIREIINGEEKQTVLDNGFFHTGDIASVDSQGNYQIKGRIKDIIVNSDGENIFPDELEHYFENIPMVNHLCILGAKKESGNDEDVCIVLELDNQIQEDELNKIEEIIKNTKLPHDVKIARMYLAVNKLPLANNMKVKRFLIKRGIEAKSNEFVLYGANRQIKHFEGFDDETIKSVLMPIRDLFSKILILPGFKISDEGHWIDDFGGDSMSYAELIKDIQSKFDVVIPEELYGQLTCVNDFTNEVANLLKQKETK